MSDEVMQDNMQHTMQDNKKNTNNGEDLKNKELNPDELDEVAGGKILDVVFTPPKDISGKTKKKI